MRHAHCNTRQGDHKGKYLPCPSWRGEKSGSDEGNFTYNRGPSRKDPGGPTQGGPTAGGPSLSDPVTEPRYNQFESSAERFDLIDQNVPLQKGTKRILVYLLYGILVSLLVIQMMVTGIKFTQLNIKIADIKIHLQRLSHQVSGGGTTTEGVHLEKRVPVRGACKEGWVSFQSSCYFLSSSTATWNKAEQHCLSRGGHLVVVNGVEELDYISEISEITYKYWIGLVERTREGEWSWVDGTDYSITPKFWDTDQPDNWAFRKNGEDCGQLHATDARIRRRWNDADCNVAYNYICEMRT
ncbi:C-type lectin domain family 10 member A-like [Syngnathoides biaculeatus]|uniref:C-type lectin domain family 10 member A-like n=1 Tax=Syngnathoides biaculeatus TaxID=300417 RepID=UPI002ADE6673|nr:C-type lectin domain family 10 member A-like [Syngnathoides biaculeatus]